LKRGLKVLEIVKGEANVAVECAFARIAYCMLSGAKHQGNRLLSFSVVCIGCLLVNDGIAYSSAGSKATLGCLGHGLFSML
jgi:hypothetical protein